MLAGVMIEEDANTLALGLGGATVVILGGLTSDPVTGEVIGWGDPGAF